MNELPPSALKTPGTVRRSHDVTVPTGTSVADLLHPFFWSHVASQLTRHDLIDVVSESDELDVTLRVIDVERGQPGHAKVRIVRSWSAAGKGA